MELGSCLMATLPWDQPGFVPPVDFKQKKNIYISKYCIERSWDSAEAASGLIPFSIRKA